MAKIILKSPYLKPSVKRSRGGYIRYMATREGTAMPVDSKRDLPATIVSKDMIAEIIAEYPDTKDLYEYGDYTENPTRGNAREFITRASEVHSELFTTRKGYVEYIATRPGAQMLQSHGLFTDEGVPVILEHVADEVDHHEGNVWCHIISLRRGDAARLGYEDVSSWQNLLRSQRNVFAGNMKIAPENFRWYAAFHNEAHHPHVHMVAYSTDPKEPWLSQSGIEKIKASLAHEIFRQDLIQVYDRQTDYRDALRLNAKEVAADLAGEIQSGHPHDPLMAELLTELSERLKSAKGKKVYGYLTPELKTLTDKIVAELEKDECIKKLYDLWYRQREQIIRTYTDTLPDRIPLERNREFKTIKNAVIAEAVRMHSFSDSSIQEDMVMTEAEDTWIDERNHWYQANDDAQDMGGSSKSHGYGGIGVNRCSTAWTAEYKKAREYLYGTSGKIQDFSKAYELMCTEAKRGNAFAFYDAGRIHLDGLGREKNEHEAQMWFREAFDAFYIAEKEWKKNAYIQYRIGKLHSLGHGTDQDYFKSKDWFEKAVYQQSPFAAYALAGQYMRGQGTAQDVYTAFRLYMMSANDEKTPNAFAMYQLGKMYADGIGTEVDVDESDNYYARAFKGLVPLEMDTKDDKLQYRLGRMCLLGIGTSVDPALAHKYFAKSAFLKNIDATYNLGKLLLDETYSGYAPDEAVGYLARAANEKHIWAMYLLGKTYLFGRGVPKNVELGLELLSDARAMGNVYAGILIDNYEKKNKDMALGTAFGAARLLAQAGSIIENKISHDSGGGAKSIDSKLKRKINEKKTAQGIRL